MQLNILNLKKPIKRHHSAIPSYIKADKIREFWDEWNTIEDIELYLPLYNIYSQLFYATQSRKLECLNYYIDIEKDVENGEEKEIMYAEIKNTWQLSLKERYNKHQELLERVISNDTTLSYCDTNIIVDEVTKGQLSLFR